MTKIFAFLGGLAAGAGAMGSLDPANGRRRRARIAQGAARQARAAIGGVGKALRDLEHRAHGLSVETGARLHHEEVPDEILEERVRAQLGRLTAHPGAIEVRARDGRLELRGLVLRDELRRLLRGVRRVRGVRAVETFLQVRDSAEDVPALQGGQTQGGGRGIWSPAVRLAAASGGVALALLGARRGGLFGGAATAGGAALAARAIGNRAVHALLGIGADRRALEVRKAIHVDAPVEEVFALFSRFESFPRFMSHVKQVRKLPDGSYRWTVTGPLGASVSWDGEITVFQPSAALAWRSLPGSRVTNAGVVRFSPSRGGTQIDVRLAYSPPGGVLGHGVARLFAVDPKRQIDDDLIRFKSLIEQGRATGRAHTVTREEIESGAPGPEGLH